MGVNRSDQEGDAMRLSRFGLLGCVVVVALLSFGFNAHAPRKPAPRLTDPTATASPLVNRFFNLIEHNDVKGLQRLLSPAFQLERADGSGGTKAEYLADLPRSQTSPSRTCRQPRPARCSSSDTKPRSKAW